MFIVIEGIDGAGCETQAQLVFNSLTHKLANSQTLFLKYPHYDDSIGKTIREFLYDKKHLSTQEQFLLYSLQFIHDSSKIKEQSQEGTVVSDRYFTTTLCYQTLEGIDETKALRFACDFGIIKPDLVFFLDVKPQTAWEWKHSENKEKNFRERDFEFMNKTYEKYQDLVKRHVWTKWVKINGERTKEEITNDIMSQL